MTSGGGWDPSPVTRHRFQKAMTFTTLDWSILALYFAIIVPIGFHHRRAGQPPPAWTGAR